MFLFALENNKMKTQEQMNQEWMEDHGAYIILKAPKVNKELKGLYGHETKRENVLSLISKLKEIKKSENNKLQIYLLETKHLKRGYKISLFLLGYDPTLMKTEYGMSERMWIDLTNEIKNVVSEIIPDAVFYVEPWTTTDKFSFRWEAYIKTD